MISRKIESELDSFRKQSNRHALLIDGARQVGKTSIIEAFGKKYYESFIKIDFIKAWKTDGRVTYLPIYMLSLFKPTTLPEQMIFNI